MAFTGQKAWYIGTTKHLAVPAWSNNGGSGTVYAAGNLIRSNYTSLGITMTIASPGVLTWKDNAGSTVVHNLTGNEILVFNNNSDTLPTGFSFGVNYYVNVINTTTFSLALTPGGANINTTGSQSGTHSATVVGQGAGRVFVCTIGGTGGTTTEPIFRAAARGSKLTDGSATWVEATGIPAMNGDPANTPTWLTGAKAVSNTQGHVITDNAGTHVFICTTTGTGGSGAEPSWSTGAVGNTTVDNGATWTYIGTTSSFAAFAAPHYNLATAQGASFGNTNTGNTQQFFCGQNHNYPSGFGTFAPLGGLSNLATQNIDVISLSESFSHSPPIASEMVAGASEGGASGVTDIGSGGPGFYRCYGMTWTQDTRSGNTVPLIILSSTGTMYMENCKIQITGNNANTTINIGNTISKCVFKDCSFKFANSNQTILVCFDVEMINCSVDSGGSAPTTLFNGNGTGNGASASVMTCRGCDFSFVTGKIAAQQSGGISVAFLFEDCKFNSSVQMWDSTTGLTNRSSDQSITLSRCSFGDGHTSRLEYHDNRGDITTDITSVARHTGASINGDQLSHKVVTNSSPGPAEWLRGPIFGAYNATTGSTIHATIYGIVNAAAVPTNNEVWAAVDILGTSSDTRTTRATNRPAPVVASSNLTADTSDWDDLASARQNSHAYSVGDIIKSASSAGSLFFCTTAGTTAGSEPGGYTSAVDGTDITDGTAHFRPGCRFKIAFDFDATTYPKPQIAGEVKAQLFFAKPSTTYYYDPLLALT